MKESIMEAINRLVLVYGAEHISKLSVDDKISDREAADKYTMTIRDVGQVREFTEIKRQSHKFHQHRVEVRKRKYEYVNPNPKPAPKAAPVRGPGAGITAMESRLNELVAKFAK